MPLVMVRNPRMETKLIHGDCLLVMSELPAESVDVVVTSQPYNLGIGYGSAEH